MGTPGESGRTGPRRARAIPLATPVPVGEGCGCTTCNVASKRTSGRIAPSITEIRTVPATRCYVVPRRNASSPSVICSRARSVRVHRRRWWSRYCLDGQGVDRASSPAPPSGVPPSRSRARVPCPRRRSSWRDARRGEGEDRPSSAVWCSTGRPIVRRARERCKIGAKHVREVVCVDANLARCSWILGELLAHRAERSHHELTRSCARHLGHGG